MYCRVASLKSFEFKNRFGINHHGLILIKEQSVIIKIFKSFPGIKMIEQDSVLKYRIDLYLLDYKLAIEIDEKSHMDRNEEKVEKRENKTKKKQLNCKIIRIKPDSEKMYINAETGKILSHINEIHENYLGKKLQN